MNVGVMKDYKLRDLRVSHTWTVEQLSLVVGHKRIEKPVVTSR
jgi:hypothetical protein